jgi:hypothetical protein
LDALDERLPPPWLARQFHSAVETDCGLIEIHTSPADFAPFRRPSRRILDEDDLLAPAGWKTQMRTREQATQ